MTTVGKRRLGRRLQRAEFSRIAGIGVIVQLLTVVSGPLVARMLGPSGRGVLVIVMVVATIGAQLGSASLSAAIAHTVAHSRGSARDVFGGDFRWWLLWSTVPSAFAGLATALLLHDAHWWPVLVGEAFTVTLFACWLNILAGMLQGEGAVPRINFLRVMFSSTYVLSVIAIFLIHRTDLAAVVLFTYVFAQLVGLYLSWTGLQRGTGDRAAHAARASVHAFARRAFVSSIGALDSLGLDQLLVGVLLTQSALGLYAVAISMTTLPAMALGGIAATLLPKMAARSRNEAALVMRRWLRAAVAVDLALVLGLELVVGPALRIFFGSDFVPATGCARILIVARALLAMRMILAAAAQAQGRGGATSAVELGSSLVLLVGVTIGVQVGGIEGAAVALLVTAVVSCASLVSLISWRPVDLTERDPHSAGMRRFS